MPYHPWLASLDSHPRRWADLELSSLDQTHLCCSDIVSIRSSPLAKGNIPRCLILGTSDLVNCCRALGEPFGINLWLNKTQSVVGTFN